LTLLAINIITINATYVSDINAFFAFVTFVTNLSASVYIFLEPHRP
jgi:hypothetical protein